MNVTAVLVVVSLSEEKPGLHFRNLGDQPLWQHAAAMLSEHPRIDELIILTNAPELIPQFDDEGPYIVRRLPSLMASRREDVDALIGFALMDIETDVLFFGNVERPYLQPGTIDNMIATMGANDLSAVFVCSAIQARFWSMEGAAVNHTNIINQPLEELPVLFEEIGAGYLINAKAFREDRRRVAGKFAIIAGCIFDAVSVDGQENWTIAESLARFAREAELDFEQVVDGDISG